MSDKKQYKVINPIGLDGRRERGEIISLSDADAGTHLEAGNIALHTPVKAATPADPKDVSELSVKELREKAKELGLDATGSKADLVERIQLHEQA